MGEIARNHGDMIDMMDMFILSGWLFVPYSWLCDLVWQRLFYWPSRKIRTWYKIEVLFMARVEARHANRIGVFWRPREKYVSLERNPFHWESRHWRKTVQVYAMADKDRMDGTTNHDEHATNISSGVTNSKKDMAKRNMMKSIECLPTARNHQQCMVQGRDVRCLME